MSANNNLLNFNSLLKQTFDNDSLHIKHLQTLFVNLVLHLKLEDVLPGDRNSLATASDSLETSSMDLDEVVPQASEILEVLIKDKSSNPIIDLLNILNITKRLEAVEISLRRFTSCKGMMKEEVEGGKLENLDEQTDSSSKTDSGKSSSASNETETSEHSQQETVLTAETLSKQESNVTPPPSLVTTHSSSTANSHRCSSPTLSVDLEPVTSEDVVKQQIEAANAIIFGIIAKMKLDICDIQKTLGTTQDVLDDLIFSCEQNDITTDRVSADIGNFTSRFFCLKSDVKTLMEDSEQFKKNFIKIEEKFETMNIVKTNKSYVDELLSQKAFKSEIELLVPRSKKLTNDKLTQDKTFLIFFR